MDPCAGVEEDDIASDEPAEEADFALPPSFSNPGVESSFVKNGVNVSFAPTAGGDTWWDGVCTDDESRYEKVKDYPRARDHSRMERSYARLYCGKEGRYSEEPYSESAFGIRHIRALKKDAFDELAEWQGSTWGHWMHWAIWHTLEDYDIRTVQSWKRFCYQKEFRFESITGETVYRNVIVILGKTGVRIMTAFPRKRDYCEGDPF